MKLRDSDQLTYSFLNGGSALEGVETSSERLLLLLLEHHSFAAFLEETVLAFVFSDLDEVVFSPPPSFVGVNTCLVYLLPQLRACARPQRHLGLFSLRSFSLALFRWKLKLEMEIVDDELSVISGSDPCLVLCRNF